MYEFQKRCLDGIYICLRGDYIQDPETGKMMGSRPSEKVDKSGESGIIKMGKVNNSTQEPPDFSKYDVKEDLDAVERVKQTLINNLGLSENNIDLGNLKNAEVLEPFVNQLNKIQQETNFKLPNLNVVDIIDGDELCISGYKPFENCFYISSRYFNSKQVLEDTLKDWASKGIFPKQATSIRYLAEHEAAHIRIPSRLIENEEGFVIFREAVKKGVCKNDMNIYEYYADCLALDRIHYSDKSTKSAVEYLKRGGIN